MHSSPVCRWTGFFFSNQEKGEEVKYPWLAKSMTWSQSQTEQRSSGEAQSKGRRPTTSKSWRRLHWCFRRASLGKIHSICWCCWELRQSLSDKNFPKNIEYKDLICPVTFKPLKFWHFVLKELYLPHSLFEILAKPLKWNRYFISK